MLGAVPHALLAYFGTLVAIFLVPVMVPTVPTLLAVKVVPPWALAVAASLAGAITAAIDYPLVRRVFRLRTLERVRAHRLFARFERYAKVAPFLTIFAFAALPLPFTLPRVLMPLSGYSPRRYVAAVALGRFPRIFVIATFGKAIDIPTQLLVGMLAVGFVFGGSAALYRWWRSKPKAPAPPP